jgi:hypothetical protein
MMVPLVYVVLTVVVVQRHAYGATEAARAAARAFVLSPDLATARVRALDAARLSLHDQGVDLKTGDLVITCRPTPDSCLQPGSTVEVRLDLHAPLPLVPDVLGRPPASIAVEASHVEPYGTYREAGS